MPIWIHFLFNFTMSAFIEFNNGEGELALLSIITAFYTLAAATYVVWNKKGKQIATN